MDVKALYEKANAAGLKAVEDLEVNPMVVLGGGKAYYVADGLCGFAWVNIKPANSKFAKFLIGEKLARKDSYAGGVCLWVGGFNQSVAKKEAYAYAFAEVVIEAGVNAYASSRLD